MSFKARFRKRIIALCSWSCVTFFSAAAAHANYYGAIAYSPATGAQGYSYDWSSKAAAEQRALKECKARGSGCQVAIWFRNACGAIAVGSSGWGSGWGATSAIAGAQAKKSCSGYSSDCEVIRWVCTTR